MIWISPFIVSYPLTLAVMCMGWMQVRLGNGHHHLTSLCSSTYRCFASIWSSSHSLYLVDESVETITKINSKNKVLIYFQKKSIMNCLFYFFAINEYRPSINKAANESATPMASNLNKNMAISIPTSS